MKDSYPRLEPLPHEWLVPPADQPDYLHLPGVVLDERVDLGSMMCDAQVSKGLGDVIAIMHHESGRQITYRELVQLTDQAACDLHDQQVRAGDRVAIRGPNCPEFIIAAIGAWKIGAVVTLIPAVARSSEVRHFLADTQPSVVVLLQPEDPDVMAVLQEAPGLTIVTGGIAGGASSRPSSRSEPRHRPRPPVSTDLDRVAIVWHTGGTTGVPKGCYHTQRRFLLAGLSLGRAAGAAPGQRWAAAAPIGHALGFIHSTNFTLLNGATLVLVSEFAKPAVVLEALAVRKVTQFTAIAASWAGMLDILDADRGPEPTHLRRGYAMWQSSSASEVVRGWGRRGVRLLNNFGSTAFATWVLVPPLDRPTPRGWLGMAAPGYEVLAIEPDLSGGADPLPAGRQGRMAVRGPSGLTYWRLPDKQRADVRFGFSLHDDLICFGTAENQGIAEYLGRTDFMISTAGNKVAPVEVEEVLGSHPAVREAVVFGMPDAVRHEIVAAFVVLQDPAAASEGLRRELQSLVKLKLAPYKYPRRLDFIQSIPRDTVGKVQPRVLKDLVLGVHKSAKEEGQE